MRRNLEEALMAAKNTGFNSPFRKGAHDSPFSKYRDLVFGDYFQAEALRTLVMTLYHPAAYPSVLDRLPSLHAEGMLVALEMMLSYHVHGHDDPAFMALVEHVTKTGTVNKMPTADNLLDLLLLIRRLVARGALDADNPVWQFVKGNISVAEDAMRPWAMRHAP